MRNLREAGLTLKVSKWRMGAAKIPYLGHWVRRDTHTQRMCYLAKVTGKLSKSQVTRLKLHLLKQSVKVSSDPEEVLHLLFRSNLTAKAEMAWSTLL